MVGGLDQVGSTRDGRSAAVTRDCMRRAGITARGHTARRRAKPNERRTSWWSNLKVTTGTSWRSVAQA